MKKGFTLIELLAVIVILAIIALIVTPVISKIIQNSKQRSSLVSAQRYVDGVNNTLALSYIGEGNTIDTSHDKHIFETGFDDDELSKVEMSGSKPTYIYMDFDKKSNSIKTGKFCLNGFSIDYLNGKTEKSENDYCNKKLEPGLYDANNELLVSWTSLENDYGLDMEFKKHDPELYYYDATHGSWAYMYKGAPRYVELSSITSGNPSIVFSKNTFDGAAKLVVSNKLGTVKDDLFAYFPLEIEIIIPEGITAIGANAFANSAVKRVSIGPDVLTIGNAAFTYTPNLRSIIIPDGVTNSTKKNSAETGLFQYSGVEVIMLGSGFDKISQNFCSYCTNLKYMKIPSNIKTIDNYAFYESGLETVVFEEGLESIGVSAFESTGIQMAILPNSLKIIGMSSFNHTPLNNLRLGNSVEEIDDMAFHRTELVEVTIPASVNLIEEEAFASNSSLQKIIFENPYNWTTLSSCEEIDLLDPVYNADLVKGYDAEGIRHFDDLATCK